MQASDFKDIFNQSDSLIKFAQDISQIGGQCIIVGGSVRDIYLGMTSKDLDIEVHGISEMQLEQMLGRHAKFKSVGRSFKVWKCRFKGMKEEIDCSIPCNEQGEPRPHIGFQAAAQRRDFTMNSMGYHIQSQTILDPLNGQKDIEERIIRMTGPSQMQHDPLRFFRAVQFAARFDMKIEESIIALAAETDFKQLSHERVRGELEKLFLKSKDLCRGFDFAIQMGLFQSYLPDLNIEHLKSKGIAFNLLNESLDGQRSDYIHLYWSLLFIETNEEDTINGLERLGIVGHKAQRIAMLSQHCQLMCEKKDDVELKTIAESVCIADLIVLAMSYFPDQKKEISINQNNAIEANVYDAPLPPLLEGGVLYKMGYRGIEIRDMLNLIRIEQLNNRIQSPQEALLLLQSHPPGLQ